MNFKKKKKNCTLNMSHMVPVWIQRFPLNPALCFSSFFSFFFFFARIIGDKSYCSCTMHEQ